MLVCLECLERRKERKITRVAAVVVVVAVDLCLGLFLDAAVVDKMLLTDETAEMTLALAAFDVDAVVG